MDHSFDDLIIKHLIRVYLVPPLQLLTHKLPMAIIRVALIKQRAIEHALGHPKLPIPTCRQQQIRLRQVTAQVQIKSAFQVLIQLDFLELSLCVLEDRVGLRGQPVETIEAVLIFLRQKVDEGGHALGDEIFVVDPSDERVLLIVIDENEQAVDH